MFPGQNYDRFFQLFAHAPYMSCYLMDFILTGERKAAWNRMIRAYSPALPFSFVAYTLGFRDDSDCESFVCAMGGVVRQSSAASRAKGQPAARFIDIQESRKGASTG